MSAENSNKENKNKALSQTAVSGSVYSMDLMLKGIEDKLESYKKGNEHLEDYEINSTLTDFQRGYRYCLKNMRKYIKEKGMWQERMLRVETDR
jgi:hypothetical protein